MGKKRTNTAKKKQAAKKKKLSSTFGVSVLKGGTLASQNGVILDANPVADGNKSQTKKQKGNNAKKIAPEKNHGNGKNNTFMQASAVPGKRTRDRQGEKDEFDRMHASLEERSLASRARKEDQQRGKKARQKTRQKKGWGKFARPENTNFAPATLTLAPKTTQELVDDAANQVAQGMVEIGQSMATNPLGGVSAMAGQSSLAAAANFNWKMHASNVSDRAEQPQNHSNAFAALEGDSDSDNEWGDKKAQPIQQFQFKPASFSFQAPTLNPQVMGPALDDDFDPDL